VDLARQLFLRHSPILPYPVASFKSSESSFRSYYAWRKRSVSAQEMANRELVKKIEIVYNDSYETYGSPRVHREFKAQSVVCSENYVSMHLGRR